MNKFICIVAIFCIAGCGFIQPRNGELTIDDKANMLRAAAQSAISIAIVNIYDDQPNRQIAKARALKKEIDDNILNGILLDPSGTVDETTEKLLLAKIPPQYGVYLQNVIILFRMYYETPEVGDILDEDNWKMLTALFQGLSNGCQIVIDLNALHGNV
jgi:hypothetical protein